MARLLNDYDSQIFYHPRKANVVANVLSQKSHDVETKSMWAINKLAQQFTIVQIDDVLSR